MSGSLNCFRQRLGTCRMLMFYLVVGVWFILGGVIPSL